MTYAATETYTYTTTDIETVMRRFTADLVMITQSSGAMSEAEARDYAHDIELLAIYGYLDKVDITLLSNGIEVRATQYVVNTDSGGLRMNRPGGVLWPRVSNSHLRILIWYTSDYDVDARHRLRSKLLVSWAPTYVDASHVTLTRSGGRDYASNGWGLQRMDFAA
jgi:Bacterial HORMA domain family 1